MSAIINKVKNSKMKLQRTKTRAENQAIANNVFYYNENVGNRNKSMTKKALYATKN